MAPLPSVPVNPPVNALKHEVRLGLMEAFSQARDDPAVAAIVLTCAGRTFIAGADITEFDKPPKPPHLSEVIALMEAIGKPVVAAIHGTALGGGFEIALGCHFRVAAPGARVGLPEIKLGLIPGAGGTQRLPRLIGIEKALPMILSGDPIPARQALEYGAIDAIVEGELTPAAVEFARLVVREKWPLRRGREAGKGPGLLPGTRPREIARAAVIGAGTMGGGIAMCFANAGIPVTVIETGQEPLSRGLDTIARNYRNTVKRGGLAADEMERRLALIAGSTEFERAAQADIVVEAVFEEMELKQRIFGELDRIAKPNAVLATNTSYLDVNAIGQSTKRPASVLGMHFFSPANVMRLLEVVRGERTAPDAIATAMALGRRIGKVPVVVGVCHGFVGNRMLRARSIEAERMLLEGALPQDVDAAIRAFGFPMGPFAMGDLAGLDVGWRIRKADGTRAEIADALCEAGRFG